MKTGANPNDVNRIREMYAEGMSAEEISVNLQIYLNCVESFAPDEESGEEDDDLGE